MCLFQLHSWSAGFFPQLWNRHHGKKKISFQLLQRSSNQCWHVFFLEQELLKLSDGGQSFAQSDSPVSNQICWSWWWSGVREIRHKEDQDTCFEWWVRIGPAPRAVCPTRWSWETIKAAPFGTLESKECSLICTSSAFRFLSGTGTAGLAIVPRNCGCLRCHRPCFKWRVNLWYLASSDLVKSSLLLLPLLADLVMCASPYSCLRSWPQNSTWRALGSQ